MAAVKKPSSARGKAASTKRVAKTTRAANASATPVPERHGAPAQASKKAKAAKEARPAKPAKAAKPAKPAKPVRDRFVLPAAEFEGLRKLKTRARSLGVPAKKSEVLRAGLRVLHRMDDEQFAALLASVQGSA